MMIFFSLTEEFVKHFKMISIKCNKFVVDEIACSIQYAHIPYWKYPLFICLLNCSDEFAMIDIQLWQTQYAYICTYS